MRRTIIQPAADADISGIVQYIATDNPHAAARVEARIYDAIDKLAFMPAARKGRVEGTYEKVVKGLPYIIAFELVGEDELHILRVIHGARDWPHGGWPDG